MHRNPAVADRFYPGNGRNLLETIKKLQPHSKKHIDGAIAVVSPHAGYVYSGSVAAETLACVNIPETVVILGPNHHGRGERMALSTSTWDMPMGAVPVNMPFCELLQSHSSDIQVDESAHQFEHSLEVQIPFLQAQQKNISIVPIAFSHLTFAQCKALASSLSQTIRDYSKPVLLLASSDMSHYESRDSASRKDMLALEKLKAMNPEGLYSTVHDNRISMCGIIPVTTVLLAALELGANSSEIIRYTDSGEVSGDTDQVVGYAGVVISRT